MKKLLWTAMAISILITLAAVFVSQSPGAQDALFKRAAKTVLAQPNQTFDGLQAVVCGSASPLGNDINRAQACIAVLTEKHFFLFDVGARAPLRIAQARLPMARLNAVFLTHYHSDHIAGVPDVNLVSWVQGRPGPLQIYGGPGITQVIAGFNQAYQLDRGYRTAHHGAQLLPPDKGLLEAQLISQPGIVWQDDELTITAFPVEHPPIEPALGYRVDYQGRSLVISGDSNASETLFSAAHNADLVFHDALSRALLDPMIETATELNVPILPTIMRDVIDYHADTQSLSDPASQAQVGQLVLYHLVPAPANSVAELMFKRGLPDDVVLAEDLQRFVLPLDSDEIKIISP